MASPVERLRPRKVVLVLERTGEVLRLVALRDEADSVCRGRLRRQPVTLLYAARDETHNNATALKAWLERLN